MKEGTKNNIDTTIKNSEKVISLNESSPAKYFVHPTIINNTPKKSQAEEPRYPRIEKHPILEERDECTDIFSEFKELSL